MITLYGFGTGFGLPEISPFVTKTEVQLKMAGLAYAKEKAMPPSSPKGQMPYIVDEAETTLRQQSTEAARLRARLDGAEQDRRDGRTPVSVPGSAPPSTGRG